MLSRSRIIVQKRIKNYFLYLLYQGINFKVKVCFEMGVILQPTNQKSLTFLIIFIKTNFKLFLGLIHKNSKDDDLIFFQTPQIFIISVQNFRIIKKDDHDHGRFQAKNICM